MARLILTLKGRELDKFLVGRGKVVIGRSPECDITIDNPAVSRKHATLEFKHESYVLTDLGSANGTFLNGHKITEEQAVKPGDVIGVAKFELQFQDSAQTEVQKMMGGMQDMEATMMVDAEKMAKAFQAPPEGMPAVSGPRKLVVLKGDADKKEIVIERDVITIGKAPTCDLVIKGFFLDKIEATLTLKNDKHFLVPMGGGVKYNNDKLVREQVLKVGDTFSVGKTIIAFT